MAKKGEVTWKFQGKPGLSGRKTKAEEFNSVKLLIEKQDQEELAKQIGTKKFSILDRIKLQAMQGDTKLLAKVFDKAIPDANKDVQPLTPITINIVKLTQNGLDRIEVQTKGLPTGNT